LACAAVTPLQLLYSFVLEITGKHTGDFLSELARASSGSFATDTQHQRENAFFCANWLNIAPAYDIIA
jgi:hypothetical protein